jgi:hypothetical protein
LAEQIGMPEPTLHAWVLQGRLRSRMVQVDSGQFKLVHADAATIADLKTIRTTPRPWRRLAPPLNQPDNPTDTSNDTPN